MARQIADREVATFSSPNSLRIIYFLKIHYPIAGYPANDLPNHLTNYDAS
jgi:hypothetical protein